jgi:hypothetical protein
MDVESLLKLTLKESFVLLMVCALQELILKTFRTTAEIMFLLRDNIWLRTFIGCCK